MWDEIMGNQAALTERTGRAPRFFRPGTAHWDDVALAIAARLGLRAAGFSINGDGGATFPADTVAAEVRRALSMWTTWVFSGDSLSPIGASTCVTSSRNCSACSR